MADAHSIRSHLIDCISDLGRLPSRDEFISLKPVKKHEIAKIGGWATLISGVGAEPSKKKKQEKFKYFKPKVDSLCISNAVRFDLDGLFTENGNPEFIRAMAMPDTHLKHADPYALNCFLEVLFTVKPHLLIIMGDFLDAGGISHWPSDSLEPQRFAPEALQGRELIAQIRMLLPGTRIIYLCGNHEDWIAQFLRHGQNPQLFDQIVNLGLDITLDKILELSKHGITLYPMNQLVRIGRAAFSHGMYTGDNHPKNHLMRIKSSIFYGHCHDTKSFVETSIDGPVIAQSLGCLSRLDPSFLRGLLNNWEHAFGDFIFFPDGTFTHTVQKILSGKTIIDGKIFRA